MATDEKAINLALAEVLDGLRSNWRVGGEQLGTLLGSTGQPDILVLADQAAPLIIETEVYPARNVEAEARNRLGLELADSGGRIASTIAMRIPERFRDLSGEALRQGLRESATELDYALISGASPTKVERFPNSGWIKGNARDVARIAYQASIPIDAIQRAAEILEKGVLLASEQLEEYTRLRPDIGPWIAERLYQEDGKQTRRMAMTILTNALVFQENLAGSHGVFPLNMQIGSGGRFSPNAVLDEWRKILQVNYYPIFEIASQILQIMPEGLAADVLGTLAETSRDLIRAGVTRSHDLAGTVFQRLIVDRKFLATFYTTPSAAALLAALALPDRGVEGEYAKFRIADFSCGTGTLLSAGYRRLSALHQAHGGGAEDFHRHAMEEGILGLDIMPMSVHLTASMLASANPTQGFAKTRLQPLHYGKMGESDYALGSLDLLAKNKRARPLWSTRALAAVSGTGDVEEGEEEEGAFVDAEAGEFDLVIMNPPFTRPTNHGGSLAGIPNPAFAGLGTEQEEQAQMAKIAKALGARTCASGNAGLASYFIALADKMASDDGTVAMVLPLAVLQGQSWGKARELWRSSYQDILVVTIAGAKARDKSFSADTGLGEALVVARKCPDGTAAERGLFVNLASRPRTPIEGEELGRQIMRLASSGGIRRLEDGPYGGSKIKIGDEVLGEMLDCPLAADGQWSAAGIQDISLAQTAFQLTQGTLWLPGQAETDSCAIRITPLSNVADLGFLDRDINGAGERGAFDITSPCLPTSTYPALWGHQALQERSMLVEPDSEGIVRTGKEKRAQEIWKARSRVHHNRDFRFNSQALAVGFTEKETLGGRSWPNLLLNDTSHEPLYALWANSTLGVLMYWWHASKQDAGRGMMPRLQAASMPVLNVEAHSLAQLEAADAVFEDMKLQQMLPFNEAIRDGIRKELDHRLLVDVLGIPADVMPPLDALREKLCAEPSVHGGKQSRAAESPRTHSLWA